MKTPTRLQERGNDCAASWHLQIDDHQAILSIPFDEMAFAAGDGSNGRAIRSPFTLKFELMLMGIFKRMFRIKMW
ncbi:hypothetical protein BABA_01545 [Neobacillus bataviensis LMG 21833]|uniref:Uncharacterized protein n=2 Tax=Neobacillus bataviensis TaxID=220685 RepID=K6CJH9_9BACI|nr:hypothetical protein BABA_01545 [Neobacillus bataviensis LMG 21833]